MALFVHWQRRRPVYDLIIYNGRVFDGSRMLPFGTAVAVRAGKIARVGRAVYGLRAKRRLNAWGDIVSPGFIDTHVHVESTLSPSRPFNAWNFVHMGVTTVITGNCGTSLIEIGPALDAFDRHGGHVNLATLVGHNSIRTAVLHQERRQPKDAELDTMRHMVDQAMRDGALGFSTGLEYAPGIFAATDEVVALAEVAARWGGIYATHMRDEALDYRASLDEALDVARRADIALHISHLKIAAPSKWSEMRSALDLLEAARRRGLVVTQDVYAYDRSATTLDLLLPPDFRGMSGSARDILRDPARRERLVRGMVDMMRANGFKDFEYARIAYFRDPELRGKTVPQLAEMIRRRELTIDDYAWLRAIENDEHLRNELAAVLYLFSHGGAHMLYRVISEDNIAMVLQDPYTSIGTDSAVRSREQVTAHPRGSGNFPRVLREFVVEKQTLTWEEALRRMTSLPADIFGLAKRGRISEGFNADIVVFDPKTIRDRADYDNPLAEPEGIDAVFVNGAQVIDRGELRQVYPGRAIRSHHGPLPPLPPYLRTRSETTSASSNATSTKVPAAKPKTPAGKVRAPRRRPQRGHHSSL
jgi:N-acyl-D-amino-acid deacylase